MAGAWDAPGHVGATAMSFPRVLICSTVRNGDNTNHLFAFEHGQVTHTLIGHQGHAYLDRLFWPDMDYVSLHDIPDQRGGGPFAFENDIPGIVSLGYDADQFFTVHHN